MGDAATAARVAPSGISAHRGVSRTLAYAGWMEQPLASIHYPKSLGEFRAWFPTDADCLDYLEWLRWPHGFVCPTCGHSEGWRLGDGRFKCSGCGSRTSVIAGTLPVAFSKSRTPRTWRASQTPGCRRCHPAVPGPVSSGPDGVAAQGRDEQRHLGREQTTARTL
jgi:hypothetical protein